MTHTAKIRSKGLDSTGVTEQHARAMAHSLGSHTLAIIDLEHVALLSDAEGNEQVALVIDQCEPVPDHMEDAVRELMRALYRQRPEILGQETMKGTAPGPTPDQALQQAQAQMPEDPEPDPEDAPGPVTADQIQEAAAAADSSGPGAEPWPGDPDYVAPDADGADSD